MASTIIKCPANVWVRVNNTSKKGVIQLRSGKVIFSQQQQDPNTISTQVAENGELTQKNVRLFYDTTKTPNEAIWAFSENQESQIDVTPEEGAI